MVQLLRRVQIGKVLQEQAMHELIGAANAFEQMASTCIIEKGNRVERKHLALPEPKAEEEMVKKHT